MQTEKRQNAKPVSPLSESQTANTDQNQSSEYSVKRFRFFMYLICFVSFILLLWVVYIQRVVSPKEMDRRTIIENKLVPQRAAIRDRNNHFLAVSVPLNKVRFSPRDYFDAQLRRTRDIRIALSEEMNGSTKAYKENIEKFIEQKNSRKLTTTFDARDVLNPNSDGFWQLLALSTKENYADLIEKVKNNPASNFVRLSYEKYQLEMEKWRLLAAETERDYLGLMEDIYKRAHRQDMTIIEHQTKEFSDFVKSIGLTGISVESSYRRIYSRSEEFAHLIGFIDKSGKGKEGIERYYEQQLLGKSGREKLLADNKQPRNAVAFLENEAAVTADDLVLSIDDELQSMAYREIKQAVINNKAESGTAVMVDVQTGEVLLMVTFSLTKKDQDFLLRLGNDTSSKAYQNAVAKHNFELFNPNNLASYKPELARNRAISDMYEPGSTVKPLVILTALQHKVTYADEVINTMPFTVGTTTIRDVSPRESLSLTGILQKSSNTGVSRLALRLADQIGEGTLAHTYKKVGFGVETSLGLGEQKGNDGNRSRWRRAELTSLSYGYGLQATPLQLARAYATLGSFGIQRPLSIMKVTPPVIGERVLPEKLTRDVVKMMESVAQPNEGGARAMIDGYRVAIKTGTAKKNENGVYVDKYIAYTAGIAPVSDPRYSLAIIINEPKAGNYYGGAVSAPLFSKIMGYTLKSKNIKPDNL